MHHLPRAARIRTLALLDGLNLPALLDSPALITSPLLLTALTTLALLPVLATGAAARPASPWAERPTGAHRIGGLGSGIRAGSAHPFAATDPLQLLPPSHLALDLRLSRLRQSRVLAPLLTGLDAKRIRRWVPQGAALLSCAPGLPGRMDRLILAAPPPGLGASPAPRARGASSPPAAPLLVLSGRFDAPALARCLATRQGAGLQGGRPRAVAFDRGTLVLFLGPATPNLGRGAVTGASRSASPPTGGPARLPADADTALRLTAPSLALGSLAVPALDELKDVRAAEALVGLPSDHLELRVALTLGSPTSATALALKLQQAFTLAAFSLPAPLGLTQALHSAKAGAQGALVHLRLLVAPRDVQRLLAQLASSRGLLGARTLPSAPGRRLPAP